MTTALTTYKYSNITAENRTKAVETAISTMLGQAWTLEDADLTNFIAVDEPARGCTNFYSVDAVPNSDGTYTVTLEGDPADGLLLVDLGGRTECEVMEELASFKAMLEAEAEAERETAKAA